ncbi:MAG: 4'-phosphopantetheinyl transferase superfamily protein [Gammaproteobacteria bacterium]|jgi:4'-phosphopantetheinyl transferase
MTTLQSDNPQLLQRLQQQVHVWLACPEDITDADRLQEYQSLLSAGERERYQRFHYDSDRHHYLVAHALLRRVLSAYVDVDPSSWHFSSNQYGRPEISAPDIAPRLRFNLTHTTGLVACVVTLEVDCGIDVERLSARGKPMAIAEKMFAASEKQVLKRLDGEALQDRFFTYWTLREAYCKALGVGIANARKDYCFVEQDTGQWGIRFDVASSDASRHWQLAIMKPTDEHVMALAIRVAGMADRPIIHEFVMP